MAGEIKENRRMVSMVQKRSLPLFFTTAEIQIKEDNGEMGNYRCLVDGHGYIYTKDVVQDIFEQIKDFYERNDINDIVIECNDEEAIEGYLNETYRLKGVKKHEDGKFLIPEARFKHKKFNPEKRDWSFNCHWCGNKVSSKTDKDYYVVNDYRLDIGVERACSEDCARLIWKDGFKNWVNEKGYT